MPQEEKTPTAIAEPSRLSQQLKAVTARDADETLKLIEEYGSDIPPLSPQGLKSLRLKLYFRLILLLIAVNLMLFVSCIVLSSQSCRSLQAERHIFL